MTKSDLIEKSNLIDGHIFTHFSQVTVSVYLNVVHHWNAAKYCKCEFCGDIYEINNIIIKYCQAKRNESL